MASEKPTFLFVHGAYHRPAHYQDFIDRVTHAGYDVIAPELPSGRLPTPAHPPEADVDLFATTARELADQGRELIAVAHSYGGVVATEAFYGLGVQARKTQGLPGGIRLLVFVAAFTLAPGMTLEKTAAAETVGWVRYEVRASATTCSSGDELHFS